MNSKPTILVSENKSVFQQSFFEDYWQPYFNIETIDLNKSYDFSSTVVVSWSHEFYLNYNHDARVLADRGMRHVIDHCWDSWNSAADGCADFVLRPRDFMWVNESMWYKELGYDKLELTSKATRDFLLLMHAERPYRTKLYKELTPVLADNIYSYVGLGVPLQNAVDEPINDTTWQRYVDPNWYTNTRFSVVSETSVCARDFENANDDINVTEKTLKTCAFKHPSIIWGQAGTLAWQKSQGFETFDHCIDESYDAILDENLRLQEVIKQIELCVKDKTIFADNVTKQKLEHNYNHFYNQTLVEKILHEQIINPLLEFINA